MIGRKRVRLTREAQTALLTSALQESGGSATGAADHLGISLEAFHGRAARMGINLTAIRRQAKQEAEAVGPEVLAALAADLLIEREELIAQLTGANNALADAMADDAHKDRIIATLTRMVESCGRALEVRAA